MKKKAGEDGRKEKGRRGGQGLEGRMGHRSPPLGNGMELFVNDFLLVFHNYYK